MSSKQHLAEQITGHSNFKDSEYEDELTSDNDFDQESSTDGEDQSLEGDEVDRQANEVWHREK